jgi:ubiquitin carboxyl-terminal hydrolase L5
VRQSSANVRLQAGAIDSDDWTAIARPQIEARILQYEETQLSFNLLALCQSPLVGYKENIGRGAASLRALHRKMDGQTAFKERILSEDVPPYLEENTGLAEFHLDNMDNENFEIPQSLQETLENPDLSVEAAYSLHRQLVVDTKAAMGEYRAELLAMADDERRVQGRKRDFGPALHKWVTKLAEKGVLEDIIKAS